MNSILSFIKNHPTTSIIIAANVWIFILIKINFIMPPVVIPGDFSLWSNLGHFSHTAPLHITFNMVILMQVGSLLEPRIGSGRFFIIMLAIWALLIGISSPFNETPSIGFSGILMGIIAFTAYLFRHMPGLYQNLMSLIVINILIGFMPGISFVMHFWGAIAGGIIAIAYGFLSGQK